jgi:hypothetical protein
MIMFTMLMTLQKACAMNVDEFMDKHIAPVSDFVANIIFFPITICGSKVPLIIFWILFAGIFFTIYFRGMAIWGFKHAIRGMRNPLESWGKSDSVFEYNSFPEIGDNDMKLCKRLISGVSEHRKFLRQIFVSVDITAPLYWWKEFDTYKVGTVANSTSTMHKLATTPITIDCFDTDDYDGDLVYFTDESSDRPNGWQISTLSESIIEDLELLRKKYLETKDKRYWKELVRWLPESWLQTRMWTANYATLRGIYHWRKDHKLSEWHTFCDMIKSLPYANELLLLEN